MLTHLKIVVLTMPWLVGSLYGLRGAQERTL